MIKLKDILTEKYEIDLEIGDTILRGKFKNKAVVVKEFGVDDKGQPTINGKKMLSFRIKKLMPPKEGISESRRDPASIKKEYKDLKKQSISYLRREWSRLNKVGDPKSLDKEGLVSDIIRAYHGNKYVDKAFEGKLNEFEGRPIPMDTPNEFAYLDFKKFAYKKRGQYKKDMLKHVRKSDGQADSSKMFKTASSWWYKWAYHNNKAFTHIKDSLKFGRALIVMMVKDDLIFSKKAWKKNNKITNIK
jgi:hypothetical protein